MMRTVMGIMRENDDEEEEDEWREEEDNDIMVQYLNGF